MMTGEKEIERLVPSKRSTDHYPGMVTRPEPGKERLFNVGRKGLGFEEVRAHTVQIDTGCLIFRDEDHRLLTAFSQTAWTVLEEVEDE